MPAALGELLSKIISRQVRSSEVKRDQQRDVEKIEEMLVYYKEDGPTLKKLRKRAEDSGLEDSSEYEQFNELREDYVQAIDKLKNKKEGVSPGTLADLIDELSAVYRPLHRAEKRFEDAAYKAFEAKKAEMDSRLTKGELLTAIMENNVPEEIADSNDEVISEIQKALKPYLNEKDYLKEIDDKMESVELTKSTDEWKRFNDQWNAYKLQIRILERDRSGKDVTIKDTLLNLKDNAGRIHVNLAFAENELNEKMKSVLLANYELAGQTLRAYNNWYDARLGKLNKEMEDLSKLEADLDRRKKEIDKTRNKLKKLKTGTKEHTDLQAQFINQKQVFGGLYKSYQKNKEKLEKAYLEFTQGKTTKEDEERLTKFIDQSEDGSDVEIDATEVVERFKEYTQKSASDVLREHEQKFKHFQSLLIKFGVTREAEVISLQKDLEQAKKDIEKLAAEGKKAQDEYEALVKAPKSWKDILNPIGRYWKKKAAKRKLDKKIEEFRDAQNKAADIHRNLYSLSGVSEDFKKKSAAKQKEFQEAVEKAEAEAAAKQEKKQNERKGMFAKDLAKIDKEESSANAKKTLTMCERNIYTLNEILKRNPSGFPYIGQKFDLMRSFRIFSKKKLAFKNISEMCETWYDNKDINQLLTAVDQIVGENGMMREIANDPFTKGEGKGNNFVSFTDIVCAEWTEVRSIIYGDALVKKFMDVGSNARRAGESEQKKLDDTVSAFVKLAENIQAGVEGVKDEMSAKLSNDEQLSEGKIAKLKNKVKSFFKRNDKIDAKAIARTTSLLQQSGAELDEKASEFWQTVADFERVGTGPDSWQKKLRGYSKLAKAGYDWLSVVAMFVPLGGAIFKTLGFIVTSLNLGLNVSKKLGFNYVWNQHIIDAQNRLSKSCREFVRSFNDATMIYKKAMADGSGGGALSEQYAVEKALSNIVGTVNSMLLEFSVFCEQEAKKYYQPPINAHVHKHLRRLYEVKSLIKELMMHLFDAQGFAKLPKELKG